MFYGLKYTNDRGDSILFGSDAYKVIELEGFGEVDADVQTQKSPYQDGSTHIDSVLQERYPRIVFLIRGEQYSDLATLRRHVGRVFAPKIRGVLSFIHDGEEYWLRCVPEHVPAFPDEGTDAIGRMQTVTVDLMAPDPYWRSLTVTEEPAFEPRFRFPIRGPFIMGIQRDRRTITNDGDAPAPLLVEFFGPAVNPKIINNTTGEFIRINQELAEGERMLIDTGDSSVYFLDEAGERRNVFPWIDLASTFFRLQIGENDIEYTADSDIQGAVVNISYNKLYNAI